MKIKKTLLWIFIILFILLLPSGVFIVSNFAFWPGGNYIFAQNLNKYLEKIFPENEKIQLKKGDYYYRLWEYQKAREKYENIDCKSDTICMILYYNLGNTYYRLWEYIPQDSDKIWFWQEALWAYQKALQIQEDEKTRKNYEFVLKKLNEFIQEVTKKQEEEMKKSAQEQSWEEPNQPEENGEQKEDEKQEPQKENQKPSAQQDKEQSEESKPQQDENSQQIQPRGPSIKIDQKALDTVPELTKEQKQEIENYIKELQQEEKSNIHLNKPREQKDIFDILKDDFMFEWMKQNQTGW